MRKVKTLMFSILSVVIVALFSFEVLAAVFINVSISGEVEYFATEIGAKIWGVQHHVHDYSTEGIGYLSLSGAGAANDNVYEITGSEQSYTGIRASVGTTSFSGADDKLYFYVFFKNTGDRYIIPNVETSINNADDLTITTEYFYFDISEQDQIDPLAVKVSSSDVSDFLSSVETEITASHYSQWSSTSSIDSSDVWCARFTIGLSPSAGGSVESSFDIYISFMADVQYVSNDILSIYQVNNSSSPEWTKMGINATLNAEATKVSTNSLSNLYTFLNDADEEGNANITFGVDDYHLRAPVYKDIDLVNVDVATGEIIGKLSDVGYDFEWYGREITLPAGTELASGRLLETEENHVVDVYTYYPTMYIRRWVVGEKTWISVSDKDFVGAVEIPEYYTATFESTIFNPDGTLANDETYGIYTRSYVYDRVPTAKGSATHLKNRYNYQTGSVSLPTNTTQEQFLTWATNLTKIWEASSVSSSYKRAIGCQGENWKSYIFNLLYLVKYADNNAQSQIGKGNSFSHVAYTSNATLTDANGNTFKTSGDVQYYESMIGSGTIGVYNNQQKGTATYDAENNYKLSATGYNAAGFNYGYNSTYTFEDHRQGLFTNQFLTYSDGETRYINDGYVGSDGYTSVFCLGLCNPWGNIWEYIGGSAVLYDGRNLWAFINFEDYDYHNASTSWCVTNNSGSDFTAKSEDLIARGYHKLTYTLPKTNTYFKYFGTSVVMDGQIEMMLIGFPTSASDTATDSTGTCDYYYCKTSTSNIYSVTKGGTTNNDVKGGPFYYAVDNDLSHCGARWGYRTALIMPSS